MYETLPNRSLSEGGKLSLAFSKLGLSSFHQACEYVWKLPYGRTSDRANCRLVLTEGQGTCSTKHALLGETELGKPICPAVSLLLASDLENA